VWKLSPDRRELKRLGGSREVLREKSGHIHGRFESNTKVTRDVSGNIRGRGSNRLLRLLKGNTPSAFVAGGVWLAVD
jgi:hypothetical protein